MSISKAKKAETNEQVTTTATGNGVVSGVFKKERLSAFNKLSTRDKRAVIGVSALILVVAIALTVWGLTREQDETTGNTGYNMSYKDYSKVRVQTVENTKLAENASEDTTFDHYNELISLHYSAEDYKAVVEDYKKASQKYGQDKLALNWYLTAARSYVKLGDNNKAKEVLDLSEKALPNITKDPVDQESYKETIGKVRKELNV